MSYRLSHRSLFCTAFALGAILSAAACGDDDSGLPPAGVDCADLSPAPAIVTDIDETLTLSDEEFLQQVLEPDYVPEAREGSVALVKGYYERGYRILYLTARAETLELMDGTPAREATEQWLQDLGFPLNPDRTRVVLAPDSVSGAETAAYKQGALEGLEAEGWDFAYAYGNATTDIDAYLGAGIPAADVFIIGEYAGQMGTVAIAGEAWTDHIATQLDPTGRICDF